MILPSGNEDLLDEFISDKPTCLVGCLSFEERSINVPLIYGRKAPIGLQRLLRIDDPQDAFPNYASDIEKKCDSHRKQLREAAIDVRKAEIGLNLLSTEDDLLDVLYDVRRLVEGTGSLILDITSLPKRVFCILLKGMLRGKWCENLLVTYTTPGKAGYTKEHLATDALPCDHLPGMGGKVPLGQGTLVVALGFEELNIRSIMEEYNGRNDTKFIMSYPTIPEVERRQWAMLRQLLPAKHPINLAQNLKPIAGWDAEQVYITLKKWRLQNPEIVMAPFGVKTHTLGMALFAIEHDLGLFYTQPKSYNPSYTQGSGKVLSYLTKWRGLAAYERQLVLP